MTVIHLAAPSRVVQADVVSVAEKILALAKAGEVDGLACALSAPDDRSGRSFHAGKIGPALIGVLALFQARVIANTQTRPSI